MSSPLSIRLSADLKEEFKKLSDQTGMKQEDFVATLLTAFKERQIETDTGSPVYREKAKVAQALSQIERVVGGFLEIAHNDKETQVLKAQEQVEQFQAEVAELKEALKESNLQNQEIFQAKVTLEEKVSTLEEQASSLKALQDAWTEKETFLNSRIAELDAEAKEARQLKSSLQQAKTEIMQLNNAITLAEQRAATDEKTITEIKERLKNKDAALDQLRIDIQQAKDTANQQVVTLTKEHAEEKGSLTTQIEIQTQKIVGLESKLAEKKKSFETKQ